jgi:hypothetical protein
MLLIVTIYYTLFAPAKVELYKFINKYINIFLDFILQF